MIIQSFSISWKRLWCCFLSQTKKRRFFLILIFEKSISNSSNKSKICYWFLHSSSIITHHASLLSYISYSQAYKRKSSIWNGTNSQLVVPWNTSRVSSFQIQSRHNDSSVRPLPWKQTDTFKIFASYTSSAWSLHFLLCQTSQLLLPEANAFWCMCDICILITHKRTLPGSPRLAFQQWRHN